LLWTNGRILSRTANATLWDFVNANSLVATGLFGAGDGTTTFTMGDINGRAIGITGSGTGLTARTLGASVGTETHTLTTAQMPAHGHTGTTNTGLSAGTVPYTTDEGGNAANNVVLSGNTTINSAILAHTHTVSVTNTGGGLSHPIMQPTVFLNFFVFGG
ncbi:MAG: hypothetical protein LW807_07160, partial [Proteobacteria bacterium]|nr:hypothetical protein [Pseudomonadota bacterium]